MKPSKLIFTHAAVFSVGIAAAMIADGLRESNGASSQAAEASANGRRGSESAGSFGEAGTGNGKSSGKVSARGSASGGMDASSSSEKLAGILRNGDSFARQRALMDLIDKLGPTDFAQLAEEYRSMDHLPDSQGEFEMILRGWAKADPLGALEYAAKGPNAIGTSSTILSAWASNDAAAAERWALDHHEGDGPNPYIAAIVRGIAGTDLAHATRLAESMPLSRERGEAVDAITRALLVQGADAAMKYPETISDLGLRGGFVAAIANRLAERDPSKAATWLASMDQGEVQNRAARTIGEALAKTDPTAAGQWVRTLKPEARAEAATGVIPAMSSANIQATAEWVSTLAGTPDYDQVVEEFVWSCNTRAPEQSAAWIMGIANPEQQRHVLNRMLSEWAGKDPAAVREWVGSNNVPPEVVRRFSK